MWGNSVGWCLSAMLLASLLWAMHGLNQIAEISEPTAFGRDEANLAVVGLPTPPGRLVAMSDDADAGPLYRDAITDYRDNERAYEQFGESHRADDADNLRGLKDLLDARHARRATIFAANPAEIVTFANKPSLEAIVTIGHLAARAGLLKQTDNPADALNYFEAEFALGAKLYDERLTVDEFVRGLELMSEGSVGLGRLATKSQQNGRAMEFNNFTEMRQKFYAARVAPMTQVLQSIDASVVSQHAGDIFYIAQHCHERMFRVEAIFALGRMRFFAGTDGRIGNQRGAMQELKRLANDPDAIVSLAAKEARDLTIEEYRISK